MSGQSSQLSPAQQLAARTTGHALIAACPGSGKTTVLKHRAQFLLENDLQARLAAVTFTKDAAASLKERIVAQYPAGAKRVEAGTFHSLCITQLKASGKPPRIVEPYNAINFIKSAMGSCPIKDATLEYDHYTQAIEAWQRELAPAVPPKDASPLAFVYHRYNELKAQQGLKDFGDLIRDAVLGMRNGTVAPLGVKYMLVDEFQDTDAMQLLWVLEHAKAGVEVTIVGDDDQAIYGFRGSLGYGGMLSFQEQTEATIVNLDRTYRCPEQILLPAARLIVNNTARVNKRLATGCPTQGEIEVRSFADQESEAKALIKAIEETGTPEKWGVLARFNAQLDVVDALVCGRFPVKRKKGESFWGLKGPSNLLSLAKSVSNGDMVGVYELMSLTGVQSKVMDEIAVEYTLSRPGSLDRFLTGRLPGKSNAMLAHMRDQVGAWRQAFRGTSQMEYKMALGGMAHFIASYGNWKPSQMADTMDRLRSATQSIASLKGPISERLRTLSRDDKKDAEGAAFQTLHASKGLEYEYVWILGCDAGVLPAGRDGTDVEEERRLLYVGITRSMRVLTLSHTLERGPSPFLNECGLIGTSIFSTAKETVDVD